MRASKKITAIVMAAILTIGCAGCTAKQTQVAVEETKPTVAQTVYTEKAQTVRKTETVYVNLDNNGSVQSTSVTDWLHTDKGGVFVEDESDLKDIREIKGDTTPTQDGEKLTWQMDTTDLYYTGTTKKELPVSFKVEYKLDGKKLSPEKIAGQTGKVEIHVEMKNTCKKNDVYLPVLAAGLMILPEGVFSGIEVENGMTVGDGAKQIIIGMGLPGMAESLGLEADTSLGSLHLGSDFTVTAQAEGFALDNVYFAVLPLCSMDLSTLIPGSEAEAAAFLNQTESLIRAMGNLDAGKLLQTLSGDTLTQLASMITEAAEVYRKNEALLDVLSKYMTQENMENITALLTALQDEKTVEMLEKLNSPLAKSLLSGLPEVLEAVEALTPTLEALQKDLEDPQIKAALDDLPQTLETLSKLQKVLEENKELLDMVGDFANEDLTAAAQALAQSQQAQTVITDLTDRAEEILPKLKAYIAFGREYGLFTKSAEGTQESLLFVYMTPSLHKKAEVPTETSTQPEAWYKRIF